jgi:hypothetical protein
MTENWNFATFFRKGIAVASPRGVIWSKWDGTV